MKSQKAKRPRSIGLPHDIICQDCELKDATHTFVGLFLAMPDAGKTTVGLRSTGGNYFFFKYGRKSPQCLGFIEGKSGREWEGERR